MSDITIPTMLFWENNNSWYGSKGLTRFFIKPVTIEPAEGDPEGKAHTELQIEVWKGPLTKALSEIVATTSIPLSEAGLEEAVAWLEGQARQLNA